MKNQPKKIKKINVKRSVVREVVVKKTFKEDTQVELLDLERDEIYQLDKETSQAVAIAFFDLYQEYKSIAEEQLGLLQFVTPEAQSTTSTPTNVSPIESKDTGGSGRSSDASTFNKKIGKSSKYHFLNVQNRNGTFYRYSASTSIAGKTVNMGSHKYELQCALLVDKFLDNIGDEKRTRNRNDFPEVMEAFIIKNKGEAVVAKAKDKVAKAKSGSSW